MKRSVVRGHHIYKGMWTPYNGEELTTMLERDNNHDQYAVAVLKNVVGHVPREIYRISCHFIRSGGNIKCRITGKCKFGKGLEVPCL